MEESILALVVAAGLQRGITMGDSGFTSLQTAEDETNRLLHEINAVIQSLRRYITRRVGRHQIRHAEGPGRHTAVIHD
jgi:hypothetical protein